MADLTFFEFERESEASLSDQNRKQHFTVPDDISKYEIATRKM